MTNSGEILTEKGYLKRFSDWNLEIAKMLAEREGLVLTEQHLEILRVLRGFYQKYQRTPTMRALSKEISLVLNAEKSSSLYLFELFPNGPIQQGCKIAGLPRPAHCL